MSTHDKFMQRCLDLAILGQGSVAPNPMVGAVIVRDGNIVGEGYHKKFGGAHAEVEAIQDALDRDPEIKFEDTILYVSLEPCSHHGKTPPCAELIIRHGFRKVVVAIRDPFEKVSGRGIQKLTDTGIEVLEGILSEKAFELNKNFFCFNKNKRPYIILKFAKSMDGFLASNLPNPDNRWITNAISQRLVHKWRSECDAILVGKNTVLTDDPALTVRYWNGKNPLRIIIDRQLELPGDLQVFNENAESWVINDHKMQSQKNLRFIRLDFNSSIINPLLQLLYCEGKQCLLVEGGSKTLSEFIKTGLWDEVRILTGEKVYGTGLSAPDFTGKKIHEEDLEGDLLEIFIPE